MKKLLYFLTLMIVFGCAEKPPEPTELYNDYRKSVALIKNSYYFQTTLDNGFEFFYTIENGEPIFFDEEDEAISNAGVSYGTGFFISSTGELATNRHVVYPNQETTAISEGINDYLNNIKYKLKKLINENQNENSKLADSYNEYYEYLDYDEKTKVKDEYTNRKNEIIELERYLENLDFNPNNTITELKRIFLGIALDDTHVTSANDFIECVAIKKSDVEEIDLAIIQIKNKTTPTSATKIFDLNNITLKKELALNDKVFMIGFNHGILLANTGNGIKSQFTQGTITQDPDQNKILYSIPTLPGSSGSPIIDEWGNLVAINFAKTGDFQGFSFGIPSLALNNLFALGVCLRA
jgi:S1-C subfamily serine protease